MEQQLNNLPYRKGFIRQCLELAIGELEGNRIALTSIEQTAMENFIRMALAGKTDDYLLQHEALYQDRLVLLMNLATTRLRISNQTFEEILESLLPWHPWY